MDIIIRPLKNHTDKFKLILDEQCEEDIYGGDIFLENAEYQSIGEYVNVTGMKVNFKFYLNDMIMEEGDLEQFDEKYLEENDKIEYREIKSFFGKVNERQIVLKSGWIQLKRRVLQTYCIRKENVVMIQC
jgi:small nuclear ribonucleoprotein (snRNP)-like protein